MRRRPELYLVFPDGQSKPRHPTDADLAAMGYVKLEGIDVELLKDLIEGNHDGWPIETLRDIARQVLAALDGEGDEYRCLTHASEMYDEGLCFEAMARLYHETGGNNLTGLAWVNKEYGECKWAETKEDTNG